jgi:hypothetical protein
MVIRFSIGKVLHSDKFNRENYTFCVFTRALGGIVYSLTAILRQVSTYAAIILAVSCKQGPSFVHRISSQSLSGQSEGTPSDNLNPENDNKNDRTDNNVASTKTIKEDFSFRSQKQLDILWIIDSSGSMEQEQSFVQQSLPKFYEVLTLAEIDFQLAVTNADVCIKPMTSVSLDQRVCPVDENNVPMSSHRRGTFFGNDKQVISSSDLLGLELFREYIDVGTNGSGFEHGLKAAELGLLKSYNGQNQKLMRDDSHLAIIVVSDEEDDGIGLSMTNEQGINYVAQNKTYFRYTHLDFIDFVSTYKSANDFSISAIAATRGPDGKICESQHAKPLEEGTQYFKAAESTGGVLKSICETNWEDSLAEIAEKLNQRLESFRLKSTPIAKTIKVYINNDLSNQWEYIKSTNSIKITQSMPSAETSIRIEYETLLN